MPRTKLTSEERLEIQGLKGRGISLCHLANRFNVSSGTIHWHWRSPQSKKAYIKRMLDLRHTKAVERRKQRLEALSKELTGFERGYLSGIIDGEGTIGLYRRKRWDAHGQGFAWRLELRVHNTFQPLVQRVGSIAGQGKVSMSRPARKPHHKDGWEWRGGGDTLRWLLPQLELVAKKRHRVLALETLSLLENNRNGKNNERITEIADELKMLNRRGK